MNTQTPNLAPDTTTCTRSDALVHPMHRSEQIARRIRRLPGTFPVHVDAGVHVPVRIVVFRDEGDEVGVLAPRHHMDLAWNEFAKLAERVARGLPHEGLPR